MDNVCWQGSLRSIPFFFFHFFRFAYSTRNRRRAAGGLRQHYALMMLLGPATDKPLSRVRRQLVPRIEKTPKKIGRKKITKIRTTSMTWRNMTRPFLYQKRDDVCKELKIMDDASRRRWIGREFSSGSGDKRHMKGKTGKKRKKKQIPANRKKMADTRTKGNFQVRLLLICPRKQKTSWTIQCARNLAASIQWIFDCRDATRKKN